MAKSKVLAGEKLDLRTRDDPRIPSPERLLRRLIRNGLDRSAVPTAVRMVDLLDEGRR